MPTTTDITDAACPDCLPTIAAGEDVLTGDFTVIVIHQDTCPWFGQVIADGYTGLCTETSMGVVVIQMSAKRSAVCIDCGDPTPANRCRCTECWTEVTERP